MTSKEKIIKKFIENPWVLKYQEIEKLFEKNKYIIKQWKGSHKRIIYIENPKIYVTISLHNNDCKLFYKKALREFYLKTN